MKFTPFNNQANANYRYKNMSPCVDMAYNSQNIFSYDGNLNSITIKSRLCDAVVPFIFIKNRNSQKFRILLSKLRVNHLRKT